MPSQNGARSAGAALPSMTPRLPGSEWTREALNDLIEGRSRLGNAKSALVQLATRLIVEEGLEGEVCDALGRTSTGPRPAAATGTARAKAI